MSLKTFCNRLRTSNLGIRRVGAILPALAFIGCGSVFTTSSEPAGIAPVSALGSYYFLPKTRIKMDGAPSKDNSTYAITILQVNEPDRDHRYFLHYHRNILAEDTYTVTVDGKGLLQTLNLQAEDKTPAIINKVADTVVSALSAAENAAALGPQREGQAISELPFTVVFDPQDNHEYSRARAIVYKAGFVLDINPIAGKEMIAEVRMASSAEVQNQTSDGVFFHPPTVITLRIRPRNKERLLLQMTDIRIPDKHQLAVFDLRRMALVKRTTNLAFVEGNLTTVTETRPSQMLAAVTIPADLAAKAAAAVPSLVKIQNDTANASTNAEAAKLNAQTALLNAETQKMKAETALAQERSIASGSESKQPRGPAKLGESNNSPKESTETLSSASTPSPTPTPAER